MYYQKKNLLLLVCLSFLACNTESNSSDIEETPTLAGEVPPEDQAALTWQRITTADKCLQKIKLQAR